MDTFIIQTSNRTKKIIAKAVWIYYCLDLWALPENDYRDIGIILQIMPEVLTTSTN